MPYVQLMQPAELRQRRRALGLTQAALGAALGVTATTVARWERGERVPMTPRVLQLALDGLARERTASMPDGDYPTRTP